MVMFWWHWAVLGLALAVLEILTPGGFYLVFFGVAGLAVSVLTLLGIGGPLWVQVLFFSLFSIVSVALFRNPLLRRMQRQAVEHVPVETLVGELAIPVTAIEPGAVAKAELRGTTWTARNRGTRVIPAGCRCKVVQIDGLVVTIEPE
ncbi:MAG: NfeD family protein [Acidobacteria bacterium]|nr:NfeD family protein [Acidobacteriota bacterium]